MSGNPGRKSLKSFAGGIAQKFACSAEHYAGMACLHRISVVTIDLLSLRIEPVIFDIERNRNLADMCRQSLLASVRRLSSPGIATSAILIAEFGINTRYIEGWNSFIGSAVFTVRIIDDRGKAWSVSHREEPMRTDL